MAVATLVQGVLLRRRGSRHFGCHETGYPCLGLILVPGFLVYRGSNL